MQEIFPSSGIKFCKSGEWHMQKMIAHSDQQRYLSDCPEAGPDKYRRNVSQFHGLAFVVYKPDIFRYFPVSACHDLIYPLC